MKSRVKDKSVMFRRYIAVYVEYYRLVNPNSITEEEFTLWLSTLLENESKIQIKRNGLEKCRLDRNLQDFVIRLRGYPYLEDYLKAKLSPEEYNAGEKEHEKMKEELFGRDSFIIGKKIGKGITRFSLQLTSWFGSLINPETLKENESKTTEPTPEQVLQDSLNKNLVNWRNEQSSLLSGFKNLKKLIAEKAVKQIGYKDLLNTLEWKFKRLKILINDSFKCRDCSSRSISNHVHHTYYLQDHLPWDITSEALVTLCQSCHIKRHQVEKIKVYEQKTYGLVPSSKKYSYCDRCGGSGYLPQFNHVQNGICFKCMGDCIDKGIFENALNNFHNTSRTNYEEEVKNSYRVYLEGITVDTYKQRIEF